MPDEDTLNYIYLGTSNLAYCQKNFQLSPLQVEMVGEPFMENAASEKLFTCITNQFTVPECPE